VWIGFPLRFGATLSDEFVSHRDSWMNVFPDQLLGPGESFSEIDPPQLVLLAYSSTAFLHIHDIDQARNLS
jgi:hypothetical protein